jgi:hypothetical protein
MTTRKPALVERSMKRTARIVGLATAFLIGGATLAIAQPWDARYGYYAVPSYGPFYNLAPHYFPGDYPGAPAYRYWDRCCYWGGRWGYWRYWGWR